MGQKDSQKQLKIFLSHASEDKEQVRDLCERLREDGFDPWLDEERLLPGQEWNLEIEKALRSSDAILLCFSARSVAKEGYIQREYKRAMKYLEEKPEGTIYAIPVRLDNCDLPHFIQEIQWVDYPEDYDRLLMSLQKRAGGSAMPKKITKPKEQKKSGGNTFNIEGGVRAGRDVVMGDQTKTVYQTTQTFNITTPAQFVDELNKLKEEIEKLKSQPDVDKSTSLRMELAQAEIETAMEEAKKEQPTAERIKNTLDSAKEVMNKIGGGVTSAINLGTTLGNLALLALKVFGG
jgi:hypothetical protein